MKKPNEKEIGWLTIFKTVFKNENTLLLTAASAVSSAIVCAIAYLYQRILLHCWMIPAELISGTKNEMIIYYIAFGILYAIATIVNQIVLRYVSLNTRIVVSIYGIQKRTVKALKYRIKTTTRNRHLRREYFAEAAEIKRDINKTMLSTLIKEFVKDIFITIFSLLPVYIMFQLVSPSFSLASLGLLVPLMLISSIWGGFVQAGFLLPAEIRILIKRSKDMDRNNAIESQAILGEASQIIEKWRANEKANTKKNILAKMWNTVSRVDVYSAIISVAITSLLPLLSASVAPINQESFLIFNDATNQQTYAAVYFNGENAILKKVTISNGAVIVRLREQLYESYIGKNLTNMQFNRTILDDGALLRLERTIRRE